jgi:ubiquinone/menaquinone biosynthesis C-methylase UbiE
MPGPRTRLTELITSKDQLREQYRDASNLHARSAIYKYATNPGPPWPRWVFDQLDPAALPATARVLELGCGDGALWRKNLDRVPPAWQIVLADLSPGMLAAARTDLRFPCVQCDAERLPLADGLFDAVIANHMLYHVANRPAALAEIRRVLVPGGRLLAATNGDDLLAAMAELINEFLGPASPLQRGMSFSLNNGEPQLRPFFSDVQMNRLRGELRVTDADAVVAYVLSVTAAPDHITGRRRREELWQRVRQQIARDGAFVVRTDVGLFHATA